MHKKFRIEVEVKLAQGHEPVDFMSAVEHEVLCLTEEFGDDRAKVTIDEID